jgi:hypothetical protein
MSMQTSLSAVYCDDIRNEMGGKVSLMGVYQSDMLFPQFPVITSKFCARVTLRFAVEDRPKEALKIELFAGNNVIGAIEMDREQVQNTELPPFDADIPAEDQYLALQAMLIFSPFQIEAPCRLRLIASVDGNEIEGNGLKLRLPSPEERAANGWPPELEKGLAA